MSVVAAAVSLAGVPVPVSLAQGSDPDEAPRVAARLTLTSLSGVLGPGAAPRPTSTPDDPRSLPPPPEDLELRVLVENDGELALDELRLVVELYPAADSRGELRSALDAEGPSTPPLHVHDVPVRDGDELEPGEVAGIHDELTRDEAPWAEQGGVHPLRIAVLRGAEVLDQLTTAVVWLAEVPEHPVRLLAVWPIDGPPWRGAGERYPADVDRAVRPGGRIDALLRALEQHPDAEVVLAPAAHLLEDLRDRADGFVTTERSDGGTVEAREVAPEDAPARQANDVLQRLRGAVAALPQGAVARPYAEADLALLLDRDERLRELAGELATTGRQRLASLLDAPADASAFLLPTPPTPEVLDLVPAEIVLLPYHAIEGPSPAGDPTLPSPVRDLRSASGRPVTALVGDPHLADLLAGRPDGGAVAATQRVLAETAMVFHESPGTPDRALVLLPPDGWSPSVDVAQRLLGGLLDATWLELASTRSVATSAQRGGVAQLTARSVRRSGGHDAAELSRTLADLSAIAAARPPDASELDGRRADDLRDQLLRATSRWYAGPARGEAEALVRDVRGAIDASMGELTIASGTQVTLTASEGSIPVTLQRDRGGPVTVQVEIASQGRLDWPAGRTSDPLVLEDGASQTVSFPTEALSTGTFPVTIRVTDPSGRLEFDRTTLSVRSTAIAGPALTVVAGLVVLLLLAGAVRRRPRRPLRVVT